MTAMLLTAMICGCATVSTTGTHGIPNLAQVDPGVWRGGQPTAAGWDWLYSHGVTNVVKLNETSEGSDDYAAQKGMLVIPWTISLPQQLGLEHLDYSYVAVFDLMRADQNRGFTHGLFIHCEHGQDRTGLFVAQYRLYVDGWTKQAAEQEMLAHGFHKSLLGLWNYWNGLK